MAAREYLIEVPHSPEECSASESGLAEAPEGVVPCRAFHGCAVGAHTTWIIVELAREEDAWNLVPELLRDTARVVPIDRTSQGNPTEGGRP